MLIKCYLRNQIAFRLGIVYYRTDKELILNRYGLNYKVERDENLLELKRHLNKGTINKVLNSTQGKLKEIEKYRRDELAQLLIEVNDSKTLLWQSLKLVTILCSYIRYIIRKKVGY